LKLALTHNPLPNPSWFSVILTLQKIPINLITITSDGSIKQLW
jgi:hypothetical protein